MKIVEEIMEDLDGHHTIDAFEHGETIEKILTDKLTPVLEALEEAIEAKDVLIHDWIARHDDLKEKVEYLRDGLVRLSTILKTNNMAKAGKVVDDYVEALKQSDKE